MPTNSTNGLHLAALQLAYHFGLGFMLTAFYTSVQLMEKVNSTQPKRSSGFLWLLGGSLVVGSVIWSMQLSAVEGFTIPFISLVITVLMVALVLWRRSTISNYSYSFGEVYPTLTKPLPGKDTVLEYANGECWAALNMSTVALEELAIHVNAIAAAPKELPNRRLAQDSELYTLWPTKANANLVTLTQQGCQQKPISSAPSDSKASDQLLTQNSTKLISRHTPEGIYLYASPACRTLLGYEPEQLIGHSAYEFFHPQDLAVLSQSHSNLLNSLDIAAISYRIRRLDGNYIWFESTMTPIPHPDTGVVEEIVVISHDISDRKQAEEALWEEERQFQKLMANVPGMIYQFLLRTDGSMSFPFVSNGAREIYELDPKSIQQNAMVVIDLIHPDDRQSFKESLTISAETLQPLSWEGRFVLASGKIKWLQSASRPELQASGDILWDGVLMDITERKRAEAALYDSEERFRATFEQAGVAIAQVGINGQFLRVNQKLCEITGYRREELLKKTVSELTHPEDRAATQLYLPQFLSNPTQTLRFEKRYVHKAGSVVWVNVTVSLVHEPTGGPKYFISVIEDITQRKQDREALQRREEYFRSLIENASDLITIVNRDGIIGYESPSVKRILGYEPKDLVGRNLFELVHPEDTQRVIKSFSQVVQHPNCGPPIEFRFPHQDGSWHTLEAIGHSLLDETGEIKIIVNSRDITERKQAQVQYERVNRDRSNVLESITEAFIAVDHEWRFTYINSKAEQVLSRKAKHLLGKCMWDEFPCAVGSHLEQQLHRAVAEQVSIKFEEFSPVFNSWFLVRAFPYEGGLSVFCSNITERKLGEESLVERSRLSTLAAKVGVALANGGTLLAILQLCTEALVQQLNAISAAVWTLNPVTQQLEQQASSGQRLPLKPDLINLVAQSRQPYLSLEQGEEFDSSLLPNHFSGYPLIVEDRPIGVMMVVANQPLTEEAYCTLSWVANAIAVAIDRSWARSELLSRRESLLFELANQIRNSLELDTILETAVQSIRSLLKIDICNFLWYMLHENPPYWEVVKEARNPLLPSQIGQYTLTQVGSLAEGLFNRQITRVDDVETFSDSAGRQLLQKLGYTSILSLPIETKAGKMGVIYCGHCTGVRPWDDSEVELLQAVVAQLAIALDQAELYAQARQAARVAQEQAQQLELTLNQLQATQAKLVQSEKMSSLGQLVAGIAHELNNPINFIHNNIAYASAYIYDIMGLLHLYQEHYPNPVAPILEQAEVINLDFIASDLPKLLASMQRGTDRIRSIVLSLRNFSRLDEASMKQVDLHEGIESTLLILQHRLNAKGSNPEIKIFKEYADLPAIECYPGELNQVFMNILINAIEALKPSEVGIEEQSSLFIPNPSPTITIRTSLLESCNSSDSSENPLVLSKGYHRYKTQNSPSVVIRISDNGPGMTESVKARLFDPFFTTKPVGQGIGLGLSISYQIVVEHHHGVLTCTSAPGLGTEFWIEIPIQQTN